MDTKGMALEGTTEPCPLVGTRLELEVRTSSTVAVVVTTPPAGEVGIVEDTGGGIDSSL